MERVIASRQADDEVKKKPCMSCCEHVFIHRTTMAPRDNGCFDRECTKCGYTD